MRPNDCAISRRRIIPINFNFGGLIMNQYQIAIAALLGLQILTMLVLWQCKKERDWFRKAWLRDSRELLLIKRDKR